MANIVLYSETEKRNIVADFEVVRSVKGYSLGWVNLEVDGAIFCFPAIHAPKLPHPVLTVSDWQAPWHSMSLDLSDPETIAEMVKSKSGEFYYNRKITHGNQIRSGPSSVWTVFAVNLKSGKKLKL